MAVAVRRKKRTSVPQITPQWLLRWRRDYQASLRLPNRRWKVSLPILLERLECTWLNLIRVRRLCQLFFGYDPVIEGFDQKPMHFNESGSRMRKTLAWSGQSEVPLKECAAQARERWTLNTHVCSETLAPGNLPPLEALFKGGVGVAAKVKRALKELCVGGDYGLLEWLGVGVGPKGSYRQSHVLAYLRRHLLPMTPERKWRILMCDVYSAHLDEAVRTEALQRGYALVHHGGGCTGVLQCNGTYLHQPLSAMYQELEQHDLMERSRLQPSACARRDREDCFARCYSRLAT